MKSRQTIVDVNSGIEEIWKLKIKKVRVFMFMWKWVEKVYFQMMLQLPAEKNKTSLTENQSNEICETKKNSVRRFSLQSKYSHLTLKLKKKLDLRYLDPKWYK